MYKVCLLLGSNLDFRIDGKVLSSRQLIEKADIQLIEELLPDYLEVADLNEAVCTSSIMQTKPWGTFSEPVQDFFNQVFECVTDKTPEEILNICQAIEGRLGRVRSKDTQTAPNGERIYESRTIDIDMLLIFEGVESDKGAAASQNIRKWKQVSINSVNLRVPHPKLCEREFAQKLLAEIGEKWK